MDKNSKRKIEKLIHREKSKKLNILWNDSRRSSFQDRDEIIKKQICGILFKNLQISKLTLFNNQTLNRLKLYA